MTVQAKIENIPADLKDARAWVLWNVNPDKPKMPYSPVNGQPAKADDATTWGSYAEAVRVAGGKGYGLGFEFGEPSGIAGIDVDHCVKDGKLSGMAEDIVNTMDSYTEFSPSGEGLHIYFRLNMPLSKIGMRNKNPQNGLEMYDTHRYFTVTGNVYGEVKPLAERTEEARRVYEKYMPKEEKPQHTPPVNASTPIDLSDRELLDAMFSNPKNGHDIERLWRGDLSKNNNDHSSADLALCYHLAYYTGNDAGRMDRLFRQSGLYRSDKWDSVRCKGQSYGVKTIDTAISKTTDTYKPYKTGEEDTHSNDSRQEHPTTTSTVNALTVKESPEVPRKRRTVSDYLNDYFVQLDQGREGKAIPTGFTALDRLLDGGLYPGLYIVGAISSLGKTTFALQIADSIAKSGHGVLIVSLEMSRFELMAKSISRESFVLDREENGTISNAMTTRGVLRGDFRGDLLKTQLIAQVVGTPETDEGYQAWGKNIEIIEGVGDVGVKEITDYIEDYMKDVGKPPVVVIDYLQILKSEDKRATDKRNTDDNVSALKRLSRDKQIPIIGISSFSRENYNAPVSMASYKESGSIEYSSDVLIGLQYEGVDYKPNESKEARTARISSLIQTNKEKGSRGASVNIEAKILKDRNCGIGKVLFSFTPKYNHFEEGNA